MTLTRITITPRRSPNTETAELQSLHIATPVPCDDDHGAAWWSRRASAAQRWAPGSIPRRRRAVAAAPCASSSEAVGSPGVAGSGRARPACNRRRARERRCCRCCTLLHPGRPVGPGPPGAARSSPDASCQPTSRRRAKARSRPPRPRRFRPHHVVPDRPRELVPGEGRREDLRAALRVGVGGDPLGDVSSVSITRPGRARRRGPRSPRRRRTRHKASGWACGRRRGSSPRSRGDPRGGRAAPPCPCRRCARGP